MYSATHDYQTGKLRPGSSFPTSLSEVEVEQKVQLEMQPLQKSTFKADEKHLQELMSFTAMFVLPKFDVPNFA